MAGTTKIHEDVTQAIIECLEAGTPPWRAPWEAGGSQPQATLPLRANGVPYRGVNVLLLWQAAVSRGYSSPVWMTYRQAAALGGQVRKGERGATVIKVGTVEHEADEADGEPVRFCYARRYSVFNLAQIDGLDERRCPAAPARAAFGTGDDPAIMPWFRRLGIRLEVTGASRAYYNVTRDVIHMPPQETFETGALHASVLLHESVHATGAAHRLDRNFGQGFGDEEYAREELVAELGSAMAGASLGIRPRFEDNATYMKEWLRILRTDSRAVLKAASAAQAASDWLLERGGELAASAGVPEALAA